MVVEVSEIYEVLRKSSKFVEMVFLLSGKSYSIGLTGNEAANVGGGGGASIIERANGNAGLVAGGGGGGGLTMTSTPINGKKRCCLTRSISLKVSFVNLR